MLPLASQNFNPAIQSYQYYHGIITPAVIRLPARISITARLLKQKLIGIELVDHIIIGDGKYVSMKEKIDITLNNLFSICKSYIKVYITNLPLQ